MNSLEQNINPLRKDQVDTGEEFLIDVVFYWGLIRAKLLTISALVLLVAGITYLIVSTMTPVFRSSSSLLIESQDINVVSVEELYGIDASRGEYFQTQFEILSSNNLASKVVEKLGIAEHAEYQIENQFDYRSYVPFLPPRPELTPEQGRQRVVRLFRDNLEIEPIRNTHIVKIHFESEDPELASRVANAVGNQYINSYLESQMEITSQAAEWLTERLGGIREDLESSEQALQNFQESQNLVDVSGVQTLTAQELNELTLRVVDARKRTAATKNQLDAVNELDDGDIDEWQTLPGVLADSLAQRLKADEVTARNNFDEITKIYGPKHPRYVAAQTRLQGSVQAFKDRVSAVVSGFGDIYKQARSDQRALENELDLAKANIQDINRKSFQLDELEREVETNRQLYEMFFKRFRETSQTDFNAANARFVDRAERSFVPVKPRRRLITALAAVFTLVSASLLAILYGVLDNTIRVPEDVEEKLRHSILGVLPFEKDVVKSESTAAASLYVDDVHLHFSESVRSLRTSIVLSTMENSSSVMVVSSSVPGEGKTTVSSNLAIALGQMKKVLLIDADMRRPSLAKAYGLSMSPGLSEIVAGTASTKEAIQRLDSGIDIITSGSVPPNPLDLLSSSRFDELLAKLRSHYDYLVIDSAPTQAVSDSLVLASKSDAMIYVVKSDSTAAKVAQNGLNRLKSIDAPVLGVVLNQFDPHSSRSHGYASSYGSGSYYGYGYSSKSYS
ncbi:MAG: polysaccharide biosynthesis tyrosine autokinase [Pseudomonadales bacterium]|nr:polysaccharide biosynthesis tyrosine autokinase [Pseudomonadales bacterium]